MKTIVSNRSWRLTSQSLAIQTAALAPRAFPRTQHRDQVCDRGRDRVPGRRLLVSQRPSLQGREFCWRGTLTGTGSPDAPRTGRVVLRLARSIPHRGRSICSMSGGGVSRTRFSCVVGSWSGSAISTRHWGSGRVRLTAPARRRDYLIRAVRAGFSLQYSTDARRLPPGPDAGLRRESAAARPQLWTGDGPRVSQAFVPPLVPGAVRVQAAGREPFFP